MASEWIADNPDHIDGERFLGPYDAVSVHLSNALADKFAQVICRPAFALCPVPKVNRSL